MNVTGAEGYYNATLDYGDGCTTVTDGKGIHRYYYDPDGNILRKKRRTAAPPRMNGMNSITCWPATPLPGGWRSLNTTPHTVS